MSNGLNEDDVVLNGVDDEEMLNKILESDDPEEIGKLFSEEGYTAKDEEDSSPDMVTDTKDDSKEKQPEKNEDEEGATSGTEGDQSEEEQAGEPEKVEDDQDSGKSILAKNGENTIPYSVLESARKRAAAAEQKYAEAMDKLSAKEANDARVSDAMKAKGIDLTAILEQGETLSEEQLEKISEADPDIGAGMRILVNQLNAANQKLAGINAQPEESPLEAAISANTDLTNWRKNDADRWELAADYDEQLRSDTAWKDKPLDQRFAEAVRRTKAAFGDQLTDLPEKTNTKNSEDAALKAAEKIKQAASASAPRSLTDVGGATHNSELSITDRFVDMTPEQIQEQMDKMSPEQLEQALAEIEFA